MTNNFRYEDDKFRLVPLNLPDNCKGSFLPMTENNIELFKNGCVAPLHTLNQNFNINKLNTFNEELINSSTKNQIFSSNFSAAKDLIDSRTAVIDELNSTNNVIIKTLITVKKASELFD